MRPEIARALRLAERQTDRNPSDAQKEAGNYCKGKLTWHSLTVAIENPKGSERSGVGKDGKRWACKLPAAYGYIHGSKAIDGDNVDCYVGPDHDAKTVYVVDQVDHKSGAYDEPKCMLSYASKAKALADYECAFSDGKGKDRIGAVTELPVNAFVAWVKHGKTKAPLGLKGYASGGAVQELAYGGQLWTADDPLWNSLDPYQRAAAMALLEADRANPSDARDVLAAMINRAGHEGADLGTQVGTRIYQPSFEPSQQARLAGVVNSPSFRELSDWGRQRAAGAVEDPVGGATHYLAHPEVMENLTWGPRGNPDKYYSWRTGGPRGHGWTDYDPATHSYGHEMYRDASHSFLAPEGVYHVPTQDTFDVADLAPNNSSIATAMPPPGPQEAQPQAPSQRMALGRGPSDLAPMTLPTPRSVAPSYPGDEPNYSEKPSSSNHGATWVESGLGLVPKWGDDDTSLQSLGFADGGLVSGIMDIFRKHYPK